ncbi:LysR family transcriptional regulator [Roseibium sp. HPY-6]|uniref:LysR family transcriptional regulator n=1 Tax=Roseibium sp. HPY-6 TaxID=3229852 RepID=UPI00338F8C1A
MNINDLRALVALADAGSVGRAALMLGLTQPALSRRIQNLETHLEVTLVDRTSKPLTLTSTGRRVLDQGRHLLRSLSELEASCREADQATGPLRLGVAYGLAEDVLAGPLTELRQQFPHVELVVKTGWTKQLLEELDHAVLDGVIGYFPIEGADVTRQKRTLGQESVAVVAPRDWHISTKLDGFLRDNVSWVLNPSACSFRSALEAMLEKRDLPLRVSMEVIGRELQLSLIARGVGMGLCPVCSLEKSAHASGVQVLNLDDVNIRTDIALVLGKGTSDLSDPFETLCAAVEGVLDRKVGSKAIHDKQLNAN